MIRPRRVTTGDPVLASHHNELVAAVLERTPLSFAGGMMAHTPHGFSVRGRSEPGGGGAAVASHPFQVLTRPKTPSGFEAGVIYNSSLFKSLRPNDKYSITGLLSEDKTSGWFDLIGNDAIWLGVTFNSGGSVTWAGIDSWGQGDSFQIDKDAWSGSNGYCEDDGGDPPTHQTSRKLIAYTVADAEGKPVLTQVMRNDQVLRNVCMDGRPARYPFAHEGGYPL